MSSPSTAAAPTKAFAERIALPPGAEVVSVSSAGDRIAVHVRTGDGRSAVYVVDPRSRPYGARSFPGPASGETEAEQR